MSVGKLASTPPKENATPLGGSAVGLRFVVAPFKQSPKCCNKCWLWMKRTG